MLYFKNDVISIEYYEEHQLAYTKWLGFAGSEVYREALEIIWRLMQEKVVKRWISDHNDGKAIRPVDQQWKVKTWMPRVTEKGQLQKLAVVESKDFFNRIAMSLILEEAKRSDLYKTHTFNNVQEAYAWVLEK